MKYQAQTASAEASSSAISAASHQRSDTGASALGVAYGLFCYAAFQVCFGYFIAFLNGALVPKGIDDGVQLSTGAALAINLGWVLLWGVQHSAMARPAFKRVWTRLIPPHTERATYCLASSLALGLMMWGWVPMDASVWAIERSTGRAAVYVLQALGWGLLFAATFEIDHFELFGLRQPIDALRQKPESTPAFQARRLYAVVRHPIQSGVLIGMWATPDMTAGHFLFAASMTVYVFVGLYFEERQLVREHGDLYVAYQKRVAKLVPFSRYL